MVSDGVGLPGRQGHGAIVAWTLSFGDSLVVCPPIARVTTGLLKPRTRAVGRGLEGRGAGSSGRRGGGRSEEGALDLGLVLRGRKGRAAGEVEVAEGIGDGTRDAVLRLMRLGRHHSGGAGARSNGVGGVQDSVVETESA